MGDACQRSFQPIQEQRLSQLLEERLRGTGRIADGKRLSLRTPPVDPGVRQGAFVPAVAVTDHGNLFGAIEFYQEAERAGIKPIIGCEAYIAPRSHQEKANSLREAAYHFVGIVVLLTLMVIISINDIASPIPSINWGSR